MDSYPVPQISLTPAIHLSEEDSNKIYNAEALHGVVAQHRKATFAEAQVNTNSPEYRSWLSFFGSKQVGYGTVHAWAKAVSACLSRFLLLVAHPKFGLRPEYFDEFLEVVEGCDTEWESNCKIDENKNIILEANTQYLRRVWDIQANRVMPRCWVPHVEVHPISHAWVAVTERQYVWSTVNYKLWGIPMPTGISLEVVRENLRQYGVEYTWLDVLCLRQEIPQGTDVPMGSGLIVGRDAPTWNDSIEGRERQRLKEWETDVPLIGGIYQSRSAKIIIYLNGLGRPYQPDADCTTKGIGSAGPGLYKRHQRGQTWHSGVGRKEAELHIL